MHVYIYVADEHVLATKISTGFDKTNAGHGA